MQWDNRMASMSPPRQTDITYNDHQASTWYKQPVAVLPDQVKLVEEDLIVLNDPELSIELWILFQSPVRWRGHYKMHTLVREAVHMACVLTEELVQRVHFPYGFFKSSGCFMLFSKSWQGILKHFCI